MKKEIGKFISVYGVNNLGKSTQIRILIEKLTSLGIPVHYQKYAVYDLEPSGPIINDYLRKSNPWNLSPLSFQMYQVNNRIEFEPKLKKILDEGTWVVAEDYKGTGFMWGIGAGLDKDYLIATNSILLEPDLSLAFYGKRFLQSVEAGHKHEEDPEFTDRVSTICSELADEFGWKKIHANQSIEKVSEDIWVEIASLIKSNSS